MLKFSTPDNFFLKSASPCFPFLGLPDFSLQTTPKLFALELPLSLFFELLIQFLLSLSIGSSFLIFVSQNFIQSDQFLVEQSKFIFVIADNVLIVPEFHNRYLVLLTFLLIVIYLSIAVIKKLPTFSDLVLKG